MYNVSLEKIIFPHLFSRFPLDSPSSLTASFKFGLHDNEYSDMFIYLSKETDVKSEISHFH